MIAALGTTPQSAMTFSRPYQEGEMKRKEWSGEEREMEGRVGRDRVREGRRREGRKVAGRR